MLTEPISDTVLFNIRSVLDNWMPIDEPCRYNAVQNESRLNNNRYITDADPYCILALLATASPLQAMVLRDFIWRNITFHAFLGVRISVKNPSIASVTTRLPPDI